MRIEVTFTGQPNLPQDAVEAMARKLLTDVIKESYHLVFDGADYESDGEYTAMFTVEAN